MEIHEFDPVIYPYRLWIIVDKTPYDITKEFNEYNGNRIEFIETDTKRLQAFTMSAYRKINPMYGVIIFFRSKQSMSYELVAHEASHAAKYLFDHIGAKIQEHEPFEYVIGWIANCCEKVKKNKV
jgi:hypothetical protein